jgi:lipoprotein-releasing system ATP-binding protein
LLNLAGALDNPDSGTIISCGYNITGLPESKLTSYRSESVGFVFQFHYLLKDFTALENVMLPVLMRGSGRKKAAELALEQLEKVNMQDRLSHYPSQLSGGERQRAALARALVNNPEIILADEPTGNLDESNKSAVSDLLFSLISESGKSLLLVTHAEDLADRASKKYRLHEGELFLI